MVIQSLLNILIVNTQAEYGDSRHKKAHGVLRTVGFLIKTYTHSGLRENRFEYVKEYNRQYCSSRQSDYPRGEYRSHYTQVNCS